MERHSEKPQVAHCSPAAAPAPPPPSSSPSNRTPLKAGGGGGAGSTCVCVCVNTSRSVRVLHHREGLLFSTRRSQVVPSSAFVLLWIQLGRPRSQNTNVPLTPRTWRPQSVLIADGNGVFLGSKRPPPSPPRRTAAVTNESCPTHEPVTR